MLSEARRLGTFALVQSHDRRRGSGTAASRAFQSSRSKNLPRAVYSGDRRLTTPSSTPQHRASKQIGRSNHRGWREEDSGSVGNVEAKRMGPIVVRNKHSGIRVIWCIVNCRRARVAGSTYFFTVTLRNRRSGHLYCPGRPVASRLAAVRGQRPFAVDAIFLLPDHIHTVWTCRPATQIIRAAGASRGPVQPRAGRTDCRRPRPAWRIRSLAAALLGARDPRRAGFRPSRGLHPLRSRQTRIGWEPVRLALVVDPPLCTARDHPTGLVWS